LSASDIERTANDLADQALTLLGLGLLSVVGAYVAVILLVIGLMRLRPLIVRTFSPSLQRAGRSRTLHHITTSARTIIASGVLTIHLAVGLVVTATVTVFVIIAEYAIGDSTVARFDVAFARALHRTATPDWREAFALVSWFGSRGALASATMMVASVLWWRRGGLLAGAWIATQLGGAVLNIVLKETFARTRPEMADRLLASSSWSFPSGHAMGTFVFCGVAAFLVLRHRRSRWLTGVIVTASLMWCVVMSFSRLYLGVHYVSDVAAGLVVGASWVAISISGLEGLLRRRATPRT
jgi:membrane-associated phospholipid phosphatase